MQTGQNNCHGRVNNKRSGRKIKGELLGVLRAS